ncbi:MAG: tetratricopeptide repeat protein [Planctomycetes bacterium]|nr:tetratricopeptide repeat protein [Planctomycetota bacterium]MCB9905922.1 tetratricopeptide repeat protein [Planctomycetota bacterium]
MMHTLSSRLLVSLLLLVALAACRPAGYPPAQPQDLDALEPPVRRLIEERSAAVVAAPADAVAHAELGAAYWANGMFLPAAECFAQAGALDSSEPLWPYYQARSMYNLGRTDAALAPLRRALEIDEGSAPAQLLFGWLRFDDGDVKGARASFERARRLAPDRPEPLVGLATLALDEGRPEEARDLALAALDRRETSGHARFILGSALVALGDESRGRAEMKAGAGATARHMPTTFSIRLASSRVSRADVLADAERLSDNGSHAAALAMIDALLDDYPEDALVHSHRGSVLGAMGRDEEAVRSYITALQLDDQLSSAWKDMALLKLRLGNDAEAVDAARRAIAIDDEAVDAHAVLAIALRQSGDLTGAVRSARRAIELQPEVALYHAELGNIYALAGQFAPAVDSFERAIELAPGAVQLQLSLGDALIQLERYDEARAEIERARALDPTHPGIAELSRKLTGH